MPSRLFRVDMSEASRDFAAVATEPGLAMLDGQSVNYSILQKWLGQLVAEPELQGPQMVSFYVREEQRGRLENVHCSPATKKDLEGPLKADLEAIATGLRKAKPESATEQLLHRIVTKSFKQLSENLDTSDFHCHFFKYRSGGGPARLVWCWGFQRKDMEPSRAVICTNLDCHQLFAHKPKSKRRCPACATVPVKRRTGPGVVLRPSYLLLLLLLLLGLFAYFNQPALVVTPETWSGPRGSRVDFGVVDQRWYFFRDDVTDKAVPQSHDSQIMQFAHGTQGRAKGEGGTSVTFRYGSLETNVTVQVGPPKPPKSISIEPGSVELAVDATQRLRVIGNYNDGETLDLTDDAEWVVEDPALAYVRDGRVYGVAPGNTTLTARYRAGEDDRRHEAEADVKISEIAYSSLEVNIDPAQLAIGQTGRLNIVGVTDDGRKFDVLGSKKLSLTIDPADAVRRDEEYVTGHRTGKAKVTATLGSLSKSFEFSVGDSLLAAGTFEIQPDEVKVPVGSYRDLDVVTSGDGEMTTQSSDETVAKVNSPDPFLYRLIGYKEGTATITFRQGQQQRTVAVTVIPNDVASVRIEPAVISVYVGEPTDLTVVGVRPDGTTVPLSSDHFDVVQQPRNEYADFDRVGLTVFGVQPTPADDKLVIGYGQLPPAEAVVRVSRRLESDVADSWSAHPPIGVAPAAVAITRPVPIAGGSIIGDGLIYHPERGLIVGDTIPAGLVGTGIRSGDVIGTIGGVDIRGIHDPAVLSRYLAGLGPDGMLGVVGADGGLVDIALAGASLTAFEDVQLNYAKEKNVSATEFTAELNFQFREAGEYRVTDGSGQPLSDWQPYGAGAAATILTAPIPREAGLAKYRIYVERKIGDNVEKFPFGISLERGQ